MSHLEHFRRVVVFLCGWMFPLGVAALEFLCGWMFPLGVAALEAEQLSLLLPIHRNRLGEDAHGQAVRFIAVEYRLDNIRSEECQSIEPCGVGYVEPDSLSKLGYGGELP